MKAKPQTSTHKQKNEESRIKKEWKYANEGVDNDQKQKKRRDNTMQTMKQKYKCKIHSGLKNTKRDSDWS